MFCIYILTVAILLYFAVEWLAGLRSMSCTGSMGWRQACVAMTTMVEEALEACGDKGRMLLLTTPLLEWVCVTDLPADARLAVSGGLSIVECTGLSIVGCTGLSIVECTGLSVVGCTGLSIVECTGLSIVGCTGLSIVGCTGLSVVGCTGLSIVECTGLSIVGCTGLSIVGCTGLSIVGCTGLSIVGCDSIQCIYIPQSARCSANLLEVMEAGQKLKLFSKHSHLL